MYLFEQKSAALYYQTGKLVTLIMALMKSVTHQHYIDSLSIRHCTPFLICF